MSYTVWRFEYSVQERVAALRDILIQQGARLKPSTVRREWLYRAQLALEPAGWNALWRLTKETCQKYGVRFPCIVYVTVEGLELSEDDLLAEVEVVGVQDDSVHLPERSVVPLLELWPTLAQTNRAVEVRPTAEFIDLYRYFYTLIWTPWDLEEDEQNNDRCWFEYHVPVRCELWASAMNGHGCDPNVLRALRKEGELIRDHIAKIEEGISSDSEDQLDMNTDSVSALVGLHERLQSVRARWEMLQNPSLQNMWTITNEQKNNQDNQITIVWTGGSLEAHMNCLKYVQDWMSVRKIDKSKRVGCASSLISAIGQKPKSGSAVLLCEGSHDLPSDVNICENLTIAAVSKANKTILKPSEFCTTAITTMGHIEIAGFIIDPSYCSTTLAIRSGQLLLNMCSITAPSNSQLQSIVVYPKSEIKLNKCTLSGFFTGLVAHSESEVELIECVLENCDVALQIYERAKVKMVRCVFKNYNEAAVRYETSICPGTSLGGIGLLHGYDDVQLIDCTFTTSDKNEVCVAHLDEFISPQLEDIAL